MAEITIGFNNMRASKFHFEDNLLCCSCCIESLCCNILSGREVEGPVVCQVNHHTYRRATELWEQRLCPRPPGSEWHDLKCVLGECPRCGFYLIPVYEQESDPANKKLMEWCRFENVRANGRTKKGKPKIVIRLEYK